MPEVKDKITGKVVAKMPYDTEGKMAAEKMVAENPGYEIKDGSMRSEQMYAGGGKTGYNMIGMEKPMMMGGGKMDMKYGHGGKTLKNPKKAAVMAKKEKMPSPPKKDNSKKLKELFNKWEKKHGAKGKKA